MKTKIVITDLTRMYGRRVCIAGYSSKQECIRPVLPPPGIPESSLYKDDKAIIFPFALVEMDLLGQNCEPPHTEDQYYDLTSVKCIRTVHSRTQILEWSLFDNVEAIFEQPIHDDWGYYVMKKKGPRSLGTIQPMIITKAFYATGYDGVWDYRLGFTDNSRSDYKLKITDLTWHYYCDSMREEWQEPKQIAANLSNLLRTSEVYLRIGLARGWDKFPDRCYLQITGIYTSPDYLDGRNIAQFSSKRH